jgi:hypothetical protein
MSPPVAQQIISSMRIIMGEDGTDEGNCFFISLCSPDINLHQDLLLVDCRTTTLGSAISQ